MKITYNGHASFTIAAEGFSISMDPWVHDAFFGSWHPYPDNSHRIPDILQSDALLLSHEHEDHCDLELLRQYKGKLYIPRYRSASFRQKLEADGIPYTEIETRTKHKIGPFDVEFVIQSAPAWDDSAIIVSKDGVTLMNLNDLKPSVNDMEYLKEAYHSPDFMAYQYSGASWHPMVYEDLSLEDKREISAKKIQNKFKNTIRLINDLSPSYIIPSAGPPCFLYDELMDINNGETAVFPDLVDYEKFLDTETVSSKRLFMQPGEELTTEENSLLFDNKLTTASHLLPRDILVKALKEKKQVGSYYAHAVDDKMSETQVRAYFDTVFKNTHPFKNLIRYIAHYEIIEKEATRNVYVNYRKSTVHFGSMEEDSIVGYKFSLPVRLFNAIVTWNNSWEELFLSAQFTMRQYLPSHDENFFTLHKFCHTEYLQKYFVYYKNTFNNKETFTREHNGKLYSIQKFCPHAMGDLSKGEIIDDHIICPSHGWAFCLKDGKSISSDLTILVKELEKP